MVIPDKCAPFVQIKVLKPPCRMYHATEHAFSFNSGMSKTDKP